MGDYLALIDPVFNQFFKFMVQYVTAKCSGATPEWTHIPQTVLTAIADVYAAWFTAESTGYRAIHGARRASPANR
jgi:hypothetical protein